VDIIRTVYYIHCPWRAKNNFCCFICVSYGPYTLLQNDSFYIYSARKPIIFHFNSWLSLQWQRHHLRGFIKFAFLLCAISWKYIIYVSELSRLQKNRPTAAKRVPTASRGKSNKDWLIDWVKVLRPTRYKIRSFQRRSSQPISWLSIKKNNKGKHASVTKYTTT